MNAKNVTKYLKSYAAPEIASLASFPADDGFDHVVVIPAYKESVGFVKRFLHSVLADHPVLMIVVINQPDTVETCLKQQQLLTEISVLSQVSNPKKPVKTPLWQVDNLSLFSFADKQLKLLVVDRFNQKIPEKQGVGLARKIGADLALALINNGQIKSPWIYSTDADTSLPSNYFSSLNAQGEQSSVNKNTRAVCFDFCHQSDNLLIHQANQSYEQALRYYVDGLKYAGSHYAFFTIGSILAVSASAYATVRGFPKRSAGEDFYLLNKVAKLGEISFIKNCQLSIEARTSDRVPFGTGPAVSQIIALNENQQDYCYYHPEVFTQLKHCLTAFSCLHQHQDNLAAWFELLDNNTVNALMSIGFGSFLAKHLHHQQAQFNKQLVVWFDAFKTLKFIHALRDSAYPNVPLDIAIKQAPF